MLDLTDPSVDVNVFSEGGDIKVQFVDTSVPERLIRRYDVTDFATPVNSIEVNTTERGATLTLKTTGDFDYLAYQTASQYVVVGQDGSGDYVKPMADPNYLAHDDV